MAQFEGETDVEYLGRRLRIMQDSGLNLTAADIMDGFKVFDAPRGSADAVADRIEARVYRRQVGT
mgnify:FL=1|tara:strand:- start:140 stop:334 length:195 start_codon:yes stop_codon:yes gene_type:complete